MIALLRVVTPASFERSKHRLPLSGTLHDRGHVAEVSLRLSN